MTAIDFYIEHKPEDYHGADISVTITAKPSARLFAELLRSIFEEEARKEADR